MKTGVSSYEVQLCDQRDTQLLFTWLFVSALPPYINLHHMLQRHKSERHRQWGRKKMRNVLAIHSSDNLTADLLLVQSS